MNLINKITSREYVFNRVSISDRNGFRTRNEYDFGDGVVLMTYTGKSWFLYIDGELMSLPKGLSDSKINDAFSSARKSKLDRLEVA